MKVAVLGTTGMLGSTVAKFLSKNLGPVWEFNRLGKSVVEGNLSHVLDVTEKASLENFINNTSFDYVINCVGLIKQKIEEQSEDQAKLAYQINSDFPSFLNELSLQSPTKVIQIGTDCVFSGLEGSYDENSQFDCRDVYGLSKVEGETRSSELMTIRTSIIGHELNSDVSLMDWFLNQSPNANVLGYVNHYWNGVTTLTFAQIIQGIIENCSFSPGTLHLVPKDQVSKFELLQILAVTFGRKDIEINEFKAEIGVNRTLATHFPHKNEQLWLNAGYTQVPSIAKLIQEYAEWCS
jgi:dTDP-4-dehydrorhamnose reductase